MQRDEGALREERGVAGLYRGEGALRGERGIAGLYRGEGALRGERGIAGLYRGEGALRGELPRDEHPDCSLHFALESSGFKKERSTRLHWDEDVLPAELAGRRGLADMNFMFVLQIFKFGFGGRKSRNETFAAVAVGTKLTNLYCKHAKIIKPLKILF